MKAFEGKAVIVTGASSGIGEAAEVQFAREGARVTIAARRPDEGEQVVRRIEGLGAEAFFIRTDVTKRADIEAMVEGTIDRFGKLDCAVNNAGIAGPAAVPVAEIEEESWDAVMNTNLKAVWMCMKYEVPAMLRTGRGAIVNVASISGLTGSDIGHAPYCISKFGVVGLSKSAAIDYGQRGLRVNGATPGFTHSGMLDPYAASSPSLMKAVVQRHSAMNRLGDAEEAAEAITWLCSDAALARRAAGRTVELGRRT